MDENKQKILVSAEEEAKVGRELLKWINTCPDKPVRIDFENLPDDSMGLMLSAIQGAYKTRQYIDGGYEAQYQHRLVYRTQPGDNDTRLSGDEVLNRIAIWMERNRGTLNLGEDIRVRTIRRDSNAALYAAYEDGSRDHQILMTLLYEVI